MDKLNGESSLDPTSIRIVLTNSDFTPLTSVAMTDAMPPGLVILTSPTPTYTCSDPNGSVGTFGAVAVDTVINTVTLSNGQL